MKRQYLLSFFSGFFIIAPLDLFHTFYKVETYYFSKANIFDFNWPVFLPLQMGLASIVLLFSWKFFRKRWLDAQMGEEKEGDIRGLSLKITAVVMIFITYLMAFYYRNCICHINIYFLFYVFSLLYFVLFQKKRETAAFIMVSLCGVMVEYFLLSPSLHYYQFMQKDFFGRIPMWLFSTYGWVGVYIDSLSDVE